MKYRAFTKAISKKTSVLMGLALVLTGLIALSFKEENHIYSELSAETKDSITSVKAYMEVYAVLMHPRCMNCHPSGDVPLQGDDSHLHTMLPKRGIDGKGVYAMKCANCHQDKNTPGLHTPPGNPNWHLPPADMKMVFQGKSPRELAIQLLDLNKNGGKTKEQLIEHISSDSLVLGGWNPGEGRTLPPMSHQAFAEKFETWIATGAYLPENNTVAKNNVK